MLSIHLLDNVNMEERKRVAVQHGNVTRMTPLLTYKCQGPRSAKVTSV